MAFARRRRGARRWWVAGAGILFAAQLLAPPARAGGDDDFMAAREAFRTGNRARLEQLAGRLKDHLLYPYVAYYRMRMGLEQATPSEIRTFIDTYRDSQVSQRLQADWLRWLGERGRWELFRQEYARYEGDEVDLQCYALQAAALVQGFEALREAKPLWFTAREMPDACIPVFEGMVSGGILTEEDIWTRMRLALAAGKTALASAIGAYLPEGQAISAKALQAVADQPERHVQQRGDRTASRADRELTLFALQRLARINPAHAASYWERLQAQFPAEDRHFLWGRLARAAALAHKPEALDYFRRAGDLEGQDDLLAWKARAALRAEDWRTVLEAIDRMSPGQRQQAAWLYWRARALKRLGQGAEAAATLARVASDHGFYGLLAAEELGGVAATAAPVHRPTEAEVAAVGRLPAIRRALALLRLEQRIDGTREWNYAIRGFDDRQLLAAAELARRHKQWERAISTAERTRELHDFSLRYLMPYRETLKSVAQAMGLDEAWVYGLIHQESRFVPNARSSAGAVGLMQLMPATARWVAQQLGIKSYRRTMVEQIETNLTMGMYYLKHVYERLEGQPVLASAAYNAGPRRAQSWRDVQPMEGAVYAETIPFNETRGYVQKVMANTQYYAALLGRGGPPLRQRLGTIPARGASERSMPEGEP